MFSMFALCLCMVIYLQRSKIQNPFCCFILCKTNLRQFGNYRLTTSSDCVLRINIAYSESDKKKKQILSVLVLFLERFFQTIIARISKFSIIESEIFFLKSTKNFMFSEFYMFIQTVAIGVL
jgi:hypothetical protein